MQKYMKLEFSVFLWKVDVYVGKVFRVRQISQIFIVIVFEFIRIQQYYNFNVMNIYFNKKQVFLLELFLCYLNMNKDLKIDKDIS